MTYEANVKTEDELKQLYEGIRADMNELEIDFAEDRFEELKTLISDDSDYVAECAAELKTHLQGIKESL